MVSLSERYADDTARMTRENRVYLEGFLKGGLFAAAIGLMVAAPLACQNYQLRKEIPAQSREVLKGIEDLSNIVEDEYTGIKLNRVTQ